MTTSGPSPIDADVVLLASVADELRAIHQAPDDRAWRGSPFAWIREQPPRRKGKIGEELVARLLENRGWEVGPAGDHEADLNVAGRRVEVKLSFLWANGTYRFQQLRDQNYAFAILLGLSPMDAHCWAIPKVDVLAAWRRGDLRGQHGGALGSDTAWLGVQPSEPPSWLAPFGGSLGDGLSAAEAVLGGPSQRLGRRGL